MKNSVSTACLVALVLALLVHPALAEPRSYTVFRAKTPPRLDGRFDDECWRVVPWQTGFTFLGGGEAGAPFQTQFAMVWDDQCLYVAVRALEPEVSRLVTRAPRGSNDLFRDDHIEIFLCSDAERSNWRQFVVNPLGRALDFTYAEKKIEARQVLPDAAPWRCVCANGLVCWEVALAIPLAELKIEPREGTVFAGDLARAREVEEPAESRTAWAPLVKDFDESERFGAFRLAGLPPPEAAALSLAADRDRDRVTTVSADRFTGRALGLGEDGWLRMQCPEFPAEVRVRESVLDRIELPLASPPGTGDRVALANGDFILGAVRSIGKERTVIGNDALGEVILPTQFLSEVRLSAAAKPFLDTPFDAGDLDPWLAVRGKWTIAKGRLMPPDNVPDGGVLAVALPQDGPITFEAELEAVGEGPIDCQMVLFASQSGWPSGRGIVTSPPVESNPISGVVFNFRGNGVGSVGVRRWPAAGNGRGDWFQPLQFIPQPGRSVRLRFSYDPKDGTIRAWQDEQMQGPFTARDAPKDGRYVVFGEYSPLTIKRLRVLPAIVLPDSQPEPPACSVQVALTNGDTIIAQSVTLADGRFSVRTGYGETQPKAGQVASLRFAAQGVKPFAPEAKAVRVVTSEGRFTLRSCTLSAERLAGQSEILGALSIPRDRVRSIQFLRASQ